MSNRHNSLQDSEASPEKLLAELSRVAEILRSAVRQDAVSPVNTPVAAVVRLVPGLDLGNWKKMAAKNSCEGWFALDLHNFGHTLEKTEYKKDPATAMLDKSSFSRKLEHAIHKAHINKRRLALALFQISNFNTLDDEIAEKTLRVLSSRLWESAQSEDRLGRIAEDVVAMALPGSGHFHALAIAESVVNDVWNTCARLEFEPFTLKAAVASLDLDAEPLMIMDELVGNARMALDQAQAAPASRVRDRVKLFRKDDNVVERETLVMANEKQFLFFGGAS